MLHPLIRVVDFGVIEGTGLVSTGLIRAGEVVSRLEPNQPMYPIAEILMWSAEKQEEMLHFGYQCNETHLVCEQGSERFMNHSCDPNTWWGDNNTMIARRDIQPDEELTYDYATTEITIPFEMPCECGSANCRGVITNVDYQDTAWQKQYGGYLPEHTKKAILRFRASYG